MVITSFITFLEILLNLFRLFIHITFIYSYSSTFIAGIVLGLLAATITTTQQQQFIYNILNFVTSIFDLFKSIVVSISSIAALLFRLLPRQFTVFIQIFEQFEILIGFLYNLLLLTTTQFTELLIRGYIYFLRPRIPIPNPNLH